MGKTALEINADTFQFFTRNPRGSKAKNIDEDDLNKFKERYQADARILYKEAITRNIEKGRLMIENDYLKATQEGQYVLNDILIDFM